jgi:DNA-binding response OmpR family regulator
MRGRAAPTGPPARLLLADSDPALRRILQLVLQAHGYQVALADTTTGALEWAGQQPPDLIVLDHSLPGVAAAIRTLRHTAATPILLLTWPTEPNQQAALDTAPDDILAKPFAIDQLLQRLQILRSLTHAPPSQGLNREPGADPPWIPG